MTRFTLRASRASTLCLAALTATMLCSAAASADTVQVRASSLMSGSQGWSPVSGASSMAQMQTAPKPAQTPPVRPGSVAVMVLKVQ